MHGDEKPHLDQEDTKTARPFLQPNSQESPSPPQPCAITLGKKPTQERTQAQVASSWAPTPRGGPNEGSRVGWSGQGASAHPASQPARPVPLSPWVATALGSISQVPMTFSRIRQEDIIFLGDKSNSTIPNLDVN